MTAILIDLDGTLTDPEEGITACIRYALERLGIALDEGVALASYIGPPLIHTFRQLCSSEAEAVEGVRLYRERFATTGLYENRVYEGIPEALVALRDAGRRLYVATSKPRIYATRIVEYFELGDAFVHVYGSELDGTHSDKTELLGHILAEERVAPEQTVMIGDRRYDIVGARNHGIPCVGVLWGFGDTKELEEAGADALCTHPGELFDTVTGLGDS